MTDHRAWSADLLTGAVLFALSVAVLQGSWTMDRLEARQIHPLTVPGLLPGLLGVALALCSVILMAQAIRARRVASRKPEGVADDAPTAPLGGSAWNLSIAVVLCLTYALVLVGLVPYWIATTLFVFSFILLFEWQEGGTRRQKLFSLAWALGIGLAAGIGISSAFSELFLVRLP